MVGVIVIDLDKLTPAQALQIREAFPRAPTNLYQCISVIQKMATFIPGKTYRLGSLTKKYGEFTESELAAFAMLAWNKAGRVRRETDVPFSGRPGGAADFFRQVGGRGLGVNATVVISGDRMAGFDISIIYIPVRRGSEDRSFMWRETMRADDPEEVADAIQGWHRRMDYIEGTEHVSIRRVVPKKFS